MTQWWQRRSLRFRLTVWYAITSAVILLGLGSVLLLVLHQRLISDVDRQLRVDFETVESRVTSDSEGDLSWPGYSHAEDQDEPGPGRPDEAGPWFEILSLEGEVLLREGPSADWNLAPLSTYGREQPRFFSAEAKRHFYVRVLESKTDIEGQRVLLRVFKPETDLRRAIVELGAVLGLGLPLAAVLSATGGYLIASRSLLPVSQMAARAQQITAESLEGRLPVANPHDELGKLALVFNATLSRLESSFSELRRFTADASHELRTPLTALLAVGEAALRSNDGDMKSLREALSSINARIFMPLRHGSSRSWFSRIGGTAEHQSIPAITTKEKGSRGALRASFLRLATSSEALVFGSDPEVSCGLFKFPFY